MTFNNSEFPEKGGVEDERERVKMKIDLTAVIVVSNLAVNGEEFQHQFFLEKLHAGLAKTDEFFQCQRSVILPLFSLFFKQ